MIINKMHKILCFNLFIFFMIFSPNSKASDGWTIKSTFESEKLGDRAKGSTGFKDLAGQSEVTKDQVLSGQSAKIWIKEGQTGYGRWGGDWKFPEPLRRGDKVWFSVHTYMPEEFEPYSSSGGSRLKFLRILTKDSKQKNVGYDDLYVNIKGSNAPFRFIYEGEQRWHNVGRKNDIFQKERWENYQMSITFDSISKDEGGMAEVRIWKDGEKIAHITNRKTLKHVDDLATRALLFTYWNGGAPKDQFMYVDDITITSETPKWTDVDGYPIVEFYTDLCRIPSDS
ncbi:hypothetical protein CA267_015110 [Alteromonas pelagimontana]|uniref:GH16 domain-containing protein n=1 Tax=Alteromonas pelagimontana TaxID=1858656 RepID=A0A6M4MGB3_9ALTE|nr:hypothetical protein [Alteromonas pelagimontana]QJR81987.1 hypothetical protein CA267_015110 [Alteromonas pelagimontana]